MPDLPISGLPTASVLTGTELFAIVQGGITKSTSLSSINYIPGNIYSLYNQTGSSIPFTGSAGITSSGSLIDGGVGTLSVPANGFLKGDAFSAVLSGYINCANNNDLEIRIKTDNTILADTGIMEIPQTTDKRWRLDINFSIRETGSAGTASIATSGIFHYRIDSAGQVEGQVFSLINSSSFDTTIPNSLEVEAVWGTDTDASSSIYSEIFTLSKTY